MNNIDMERRINELLAQMTLKEKVALLSGIDNWRTAAIPHLGIRSVVMTDGPHGVRTEATSDYRPVGPATAFPTGISMAASWDPALIERVAMALAEETRALGCDVLLGPCVNIVRVPLAGRNFESYAEDPYLAGRIGVAWVKGLQSKGVGASLKHYACNNQEFERLRGDSVLDERTLREIYLAQFEMVVKEAQPWTVMCSYNRINGVYASQHTYLLRDILKGEWGYEGAVISDWGANHTVFESVAGGLDLEMPGPAKYYGQLLQEAVLTWQIDPQWVDDAARRMLQLIARTGKLEAEDSPHEGAVNTPEHQALARELAENAITLLKNEGDLLPLEGVRSVAVIGPNALETPSGGGSSHVVPPYSVGPLEGLRAVFGAEVQLAYEQGSDNWEDPPILRSALVTPTQGEGQGFYVEYFDNAAFAGDPVASKVEEALAFWWLPLPEGMSRDEFGVRYTATLTAEQSGRHIFRLLNSSVARLYLDGELILENEAPPLGHSALGPQVGAQVYVTLEAGRSYDLRVDYSKPSAMDFSALYLQFAYAPPPEADDRIARAVALAREAEVAVIFAGFATGYESEGGDRPHMGLPNRQDELIAAVAAANPKTVVVVNAGAPVAMPWVDAVAAVVLAYYPGMEGGHAVARVLTGQVNPSGKLPVTFPVRYEDNPSYGHYPGGRDVRYGEGLLVGYRYYDTKGIAPLFPFGHGLSYTRFALSALVAPKMAEIAALDETPVEVAVTVTNIGSRPGAEVVQLYVRDVAASLMRPQKELKGFAKVALQPGESRTVAFALDRRAFAFYDPYERAWVVEPGDFELLVGTSSWDIRAQATVTVK